MSGDIYLLQTREFIALKQNVYKFGMTRDIDRRIKQYPKSSVVLFTWKVTDRIVAENAIKLVIGNHFKVRKEFGSEYIEGNANEIFKFVSDFLYNNKFIVTNGYDYSFEKEEKEKHIQKDKPERKKSQTTMRKPKTYNTMTNMEKELLMSEFVDQKKNIYKSQTLKSYEIYKEFHQYVQINFKHKNVNISMKKLSSFICQNIEGAYKSRINTEEGFCDCIVFANKEVNVTEEEKIQAFFEQYLVADPQTYTTLQNIKEQLKQSEIYNYKHLKLKIENYTNKKFLTYKYFGSKKVRSVLEGYTLQEINVDH